MAQPTMLQKMNVYHAAILTANEDIFNGDPATDVLSMENYEEIVFIIVKGAGAVGTADITVESCDDTTPTTTTAVAFRYQATTSGNTIGAVTAAAAAGFTTTAGADQTYCISIKSDELSGDDKYVRLQATENADGACDGAILAIGFYPRYEQDVPVEMIT